MALDCSKTLKKIGIDLLCIFLNSWNKNSIYLALWLLDQISLWYKDEVTNNISLVFWCLEDHDEGVKSLARGILIKSSTKNSY